MSHNPAFDSSIPVLTEVVLEPAPPAAEPAGQARAESPAAAVPDEAPAPAAPVVAPAGQAQAAPIAAPAAQAQAAAAEPDWDELERRIAERVLAQLQPQLDAVVRNALASAADQIHIGLRQAVEQVVAQQVAAVQFGRPPGV
ncbi:MAG: hypothetical protein JWQ80_894 [Massilia sp.]|nr:hypothetical protein [Massilia sp.]